MNEIDDIIEGFVESAGSLGASLGISKVVAQIYSLLYLSQEPLTLDDISEKLKMSKGNVCMNIKYLEQWNAVKKTWKKGSRKDYYTANLDVEKIILQRIKEGIDRRLEDFIRSIEHIEKKVKLQENGKENKEFIRNMQERIKKIRDFHSLFKKFVVLSKTFL